MLCPMASEMVKIARSSPDEYIDAQNYDKRIKRLMMEKEQLPVVLEAIDAQNKAMEGDPDRFTALQGLAGGAMTGGSLGIIGSNLHNMNALSKGKKLMFRQVLKRTGIAGGIGAGLGAIGGAYLGNKALEASPLGKKYKAIDENMKRKIALINAKYS